MLDKLHSLITKEERKSERLNFTVLLLFIVIFSLTCLAAFGTKHAFFYTDSDRIDNSQEKWYSNQKEFDSFGEELDVYTITINKDITNSDNLDLAVGIYNYYSSISIKVDNQDIFTYGTVEDIRNNVRLGNLYSIVNLPIDLNQTKTLSITYGSAYPLTIYTPDIGDNSTLHKALAISNIPVIFTAALGLFMFMALSFVSLFRKTRDILPSAIRWGMILLLTSTMWIIADSQFLMNLGFNAGIVCQLSFNLYPLFVLSLLRLTDLITGEQAKFVKYIYAICILNFLVVNILDVLNIVPFIQSLMSTHITTAIVMISVLIIAYKEYSTKHTLVSIITFFGTSGFVVLAAIQYVLFFINPTSSNSTILIFALTILNMSFAARIARSIQLELRKEDKMHKKEIEEANKELKKKNELLYKTFGKFVPDESIDELLNQSSSSIEGAWVEASIMECDIRDFSSMIIPMEPSEVIDMLNNYFEVASEIIQKYKGTVIEYEGDSVMAVFGAPVTDENHASSATAAALELQCSINKINRYNSARNYPNFEIGIGISTGKLQIGYLGSQKHMKFDVIGTTVNLASRIQTYTIGGQVLISENTKERIENIDCTLLNRVRPKGLNRDICIYHVTGIGHPYNITQIVKKEKIIILDKPKTIIFHRLTEKFIDPKNYKLTVYSYTRNSLYVQTDTNLEVFDNVELIADDVVYYGKVISIEDKMYCIRVTDHTNPLKKNES